MTGTTEFLTRDGDINQEDLTNDAVGSGGMTCHHFSLTDNPGVNHFELPVEPDCPRPPDLERQRTALTVPLNEAGLSRTSGSGP